MASTARARRRASVILTMTLALMTVRADAKSQITRTLRMRTADARALVRDTYLYVPIRVPEGAWHVVKYEPSAKQEIVHHMLLYGCRDAAASGLDKVVGGMYSSGSHVATCGDGTSQALLYGWGKNAPPMHMPEDVGFRVGEGAFRVLVLEVHYLEKQSAGAVGKSGLDVILASGRPKMSASVLAWASYFSLQPGKKDELVAATCAYEQSRELKAFGFRVHTHDRGTRVWLDRLVGGDPGKPVRVLERDPQLPQEFELLSEKGTSLTVSAGDALRVTCSFDTTNETAVVNAGFGASHEMCNMYVMVYSDEPQYLSCLGSNDGSMGKFALEVGDAKQPIEDMDAVRARVVPSRVKWPALGGIGGIQATSDGEYVWMTNRGPNVWEAGSSLSEAKTIQEDAIVRMNLFTGAIDRAFGANAHVMPHGIRIAPDGSIWVTDTALHQVFQYSPDSGERVRAFGQAGVKRGGGEGFCAPADVLVLEDGSFIVADGYGLCPNRIARFGADGAYAGDFDLGSAGKVSVAHQLAYSQVRREIALADRENSRVILFDYAGKFKQAVDLSEHGFAYGLAWMGSSLEGLGGYYALCWTRDAPNPKTSLVRIFWTGDNAPVTHVWDLNAMGVIFKSPHVLAAQSSKNGGTASWGAGLTLHIGSTTSTIGKNYQRLWLGLNEPRALEPPSRSASAARGVAPPRLRAPAVLIAHPIAAILCAGLAVIALAHARRQRAPPAPSRPWPRDVESVAFRDFADDDDSDDDDSDAPPRDSAPIPPHRRGLKLAKD